MAWVTRARGAGIAASAVGVWACAEPPANISNNTNDARSEAIPRTCDEGVFIFGPFSIWNLLESGNSSCGASGGGSRWRTERWLSDPWFWAESGACAGLHALDGTRPFATYSIANDAWVL